MRLIILTVLISLVFAYAGNRLANKKGYNPTSWAVYGFCFPLIALIVQLLMPSKKAN